MISLKPEWRALLVLSLLLMHAAGQAASSRLLATGGVMQLEGAAGGGLSPWALIAGLGSRDEIGGSAFCTRVAPQDFTLQSCGVAVGVRDRVEVSFAQQRFDLGTTVPGEVIHQKVIGLKIRLAGDAVYDQDQWLPQLALGAQYKINQDYDFVPKLLGARDDRDTDLYVAATKLWLSGIAGRNTLLNLTVRATRANQLGILGFGGDRDNSYQLQPEGSVAVFLFDPLIVGAEYRFKPDNLGVFKEDDFKDVFIAWLPHKSVALTLAYAALGNIADKRDQQGVYLSLQGSF